MIKRTILALSAILCTSAIAQELGTEWGTADREAEYYRIVELPVPDPLFIEAGSFVNLPNDEIAIGTRRGEILIASGAFEKHPRPTYRVFASGLDEVLGLEWKDGIFYATQQCEVTKISEYVVPRRSPMLGESVGAYLFRFEENDTAFETLYVSSYYRDDDPNIIAHVAISTKAKPGG